MRFCVHAYLKINCSSVVEALAHLRNDQVYTNQYEPHCMTVIEENKILHTGVPIENVEMTNLILAEERPCHGTVESRHLSFSTCSGV